MRLLITIFALLYSMVSFAQHDWDSKNWNKESLGFGCSVDGQMTKPVLNMTELFMEKRFDKIRQLLNSEVCADQYLATFVLERLESKKELEITDDQGQRISEIKRSNKLVPFCAGCTLWTEIPLKDLFNEKTQEIVSRSADNWFDHLYKMYYKNRKAEKKID